MNSSMIRGIFELIKRNKILNSLKSLRAIFLIFQKIASQIVPL